MAMLRIMTVAYCNKR